MSPAYLSWNLCAGVDLPIFDPYPMHQFISELAHFPALRASSLFRIRSNISGLTDTPVGP